MTTTSSELESLLHFADGDFDQVAEMMRDFNMKEPLAAPKSKRQEGANIRTTGDEDEDDPRPEGPRKGEIRQADKDIIKQMSGNPNPRQTKKLRISAGPIPVQIKYFVNLTFLNCQFTTPPLTSLPPEIGELSQLQSLDCSDNELTELPAWIEKLSQLKDLWCSFNQLSKLPPEIGKLSQLQSLYCNNNELTELPPQIKQLSQLQSLDCSDNELTSLPPEIGELSQLQSLDCNKNQLTSLPAEIGQLSQLQSLHCYNNRLTSLPPEIGLLSQLQSLHCYNNRLTSLPAEIGQLSQLQSLHCYNNWLTSLPPEIGKLSKLESMNVYSNRFVRLPLSLASLKKERLEFLLNSTDGKAMIGVVREMLQPIYEEQQRVILAPFVRWKFAMDKMGSQVGHVLPSDIAREIQKRVEAEMDKKYVIYRWNDDSKKYEFVLED